MKSTINLKRSLIKKKYFIFVEFCGTYRYINESGRFSSYLTYRRDWSSSPVMWPVYSDIIHPYTIKANSYEEAFEYMKEDFFHKTSDTGKYKLKSLHDGIYFLVPAEVLKVTRSDEVRAIISKAIRKSSERRNKGLISNILWWINKILF